MPDSNLASQKRKILYIFTRQQKVQGLALAVGMLFGAGLEVLGIGLVVPIVTLMTDPELALNLKYVGPVLAALGIDDRREMLLGGGGAMILMMVIKSGYLAVLYRAMYRFVFRQQVNLSQELLEGYLTAPYTFHLDRNTAELVRNCTETTFRFVAGYMIWLLITITELLVLGAIVALLIFLEPVATLGALLVLVAPAALFFIAVRRRLGAMGTAREESMALLIQWINQSLGGIKELLLLHQPEFFLNHHKVQATRTADATRTLLFLNAMPRLIIDSVAAVGMFGVIIALVLGGRDMQDLLPLLGMFAIAAARMIPSINRIVTGFNSMQFNRAALDNIYSELRYAREQKAAVAIGTDHGDADRGDAESRLSFTDAIDIVDMSYRYPNAERPAVSNLSLRIKKGSFVGFVGPTGCGKTTVADVILGLLEPTEGSVLVDGRNIRDALFDWQRQLSYIPQEVYLLDGTIRQNVAFAVASDEIVDERVWRALRRAQIDDLVRELPQGLDSPVGERGVRISGGERQRLGIARALYRNPAVLVVDEATASIDSETEAAVMRALEALRGDKTLIVITHRLATVRNCDEIFVMGNGGIQASGTYAELVQRSAEFRQLVGLADAP